MLFRLANCALQPFSSCAASATRPPADVFLLHQASLYYPPIQVRICYPVQVQSCILIELCSQLPFPSLTSSSHLTPSSFALARTNHSCRLANSDATSALLSCRSDLSSLALPTSWMLDALIRRYLRVHIIRDGHLLAAATPTSVASLRCGLD